MAMRENITDPALVERWQEMMAQRQALLQQEAQAQQPVRSNASWSGELLLLLFLFGLVAMPVAGVITVFAFQEGQPPWPVVAGAWLVVAGWAVVLRWRAKAFDRRQVAARSDSALLERLAANHRGHRCVSEDCWACVQLKQRKPVASFSVAEPFLDDPDISALTDQIEALKQQTEGDTQ